MGMCLHVSVCLSVVFSFVCVCVCVYVCVLKRLHVGMCTRFRWCLIVDGCYV